MPEKYQEVVVYLGDLVFFSRGACQKSTRDVQVSQDFQRMIVA
jgi:hypothetical protein